MTCQLHARELLQSALLGELEPARAAELAACRDCAPQLEALRAVEASLRVRAGDPAAGAASDADAQRARELVRRTYAERIAPTRGAHAAGPRRWRLAAAALLAVGLGLAVWALTRRGAAIGPDPLMLGNRAAEIIAPQGAAASFAEFRWRCERADAVTFTLRVYAGDASSDEPLYVRHALEGFAHRVDDGELASWPNRIHWVLQPCDATGSPLPGAADAADARLGP